ncbi:p-aminobenzoyl-glutamate hydrolase subunit B [Paraliobacillus sp. PM-2]|uniref:M20 family metallopeptidase n=1 Tax=Paraliobacillus sp. PM-2 TaxID=1462524 RepID=UPI00061C8646|nr:M20 family metallopeptidase [Paraliobacillus sp. PM-2]CQR47888.1 p-aminobenzoyl-glutamate hydrolase subunit B [Paraliobacillus sp. PM-2]
MEELHKVVDQIKFRLWEISDDLFEHPELGDKEYRSMGVLVDFLKEHRFEVETGLVNRETSFKAVFDSGQSGPTVAFMAEYDALPGVGHGCGHNMIATMGTGAGVALSKVLDQIGGKVVVFGTPAEETNGAKVPMAESGLFDDMDVAMMVHPGDVSTESGESLAMDAIQFAYFGKTSHAAAAPEEGINALDSVIQLFNGINALRQHVKSDVRMHGVIKEGGVAANVVPDKAVAQFYVRAKDRSYLNKVVAQVKEIAQGAAAMTGAKLEISNYELSYDDMRTNKILSDQFTKNLYQAGETKVLPQKISYGSIDMGNVSQVCPAIHPYIGFDKPGLVPHTTEFANETVTENGHNVIARGALALALTGADIIQQPDLLKSIKAGFDNQHK